MRQNDEEIQKKVVYCPHTQLEFNFSLYPPMQKYYGLKSAMHRNHNA